MQTDFALQAQKKIIISDAEEAEKISLFFLLFFFLTQHIFLGSLEELDSIRTEEWATEDFEAHFFPSSCFQIYFHFHTSAPTNTDSVLLFRQFISLWNH